MGYNSRLDEVQAAILRIKLKNLDYYIERRIKKAQYYNKFFEEKGLGKYINYPKYFDNRVHVYHQYVISVKNEEERDNLKKFLKENGIETGIYYPLGLHLQKCFENLGYKEGDFPITEKATRTTLALPMFPELTRYEQEYVVRKIKEFYTSL